MRTTKRLAAFGTAVVVLTVGAAPLLSSGADHLDAPALGGATAMGEIAPHSEHGDRDINDVYLFQAPDSSSRTAIAVTVNPAINLFGGNFGTNVRYAINIDTNGDNVQDLAYVATFGDEQGDGNQHWKLTKYTGSRAVSLTGGKPVVQAFTNSSDKTKAGGGLWAWAGVRSDPFFFDLTGFIGTVTGLLGNKVGNDDLGNDPQDFFANLNVNAIVLAVPNSTLPDTIGVWATTSWWDGDSWRKADQMGRPAINTVFNLSGADKDLFNRTAPSMQATASGGKFVNNVTGVLQFLSGLDSEGAYSNDQAGFLASVLIPDVLVYSRSNPLGFPAPLNGRALADDVIDVELRVSTGGDPLNLFGADGLTGLGPDRDASGAVNGDGIGAHSDYSSSFPYLGAPH
ncbi:MAG: DUF4331 family protein [Chloroflexota bacterium]